MDGHVYLRGDVGEVTVALENSEGTKTYASKRLPVGNDWKKLSFRLTPKVTDRTPASRCVSTVRGRCGRRAVLFDGDRFSRQPLRGDIARALVAEGDVPSVWRNDGQRPRLPLKSMIGDPDRRPIYRGTGIRSRPTASASSSSSDSARRPASAPRSRSTPRRRRKMPPTCRLSHRPHNVLGRPAVGGMSHGPYHPAYIEIGNEEAIDRMSHATSPTTRAFPPD